MPAGAQSTELLIIGAGPYGLSMASYAKQAGLDYRLQGKPMELWEEHTPRQMTLATFYETSLKDPARAATLMRYCALNGIPVPEGRASPSRELFLRYARWWIAEAGLESDGRHVKRLAHGEGAFEATLDGGARIEAARVLIAAGTFYHRYVPPFYSQRLPRERFSHTLEATQLERFAGQRVLVVGGGLSALEWSAILSEVGAEVTCAYRHAPWDVETGKSYIAVNVMQWRDLSEADPEWYRSLSPSKREEILEGIRRHTPPAPWLRERLSKVRFLPHTEIADAAANTHVRVDFVSGETIEVDHVILGTGFVADIANVPFWDRETILAQIATSNGYPVLDQYFQSSIPGLYFAGILAMQDFGPIFRFVSGSGVAPPHILQHISQHRPRISS
ncbi:MAG TPA: NAD(P)-binding domain-containing protein [Chloroflexota bacterium]|nr:NAD(P)-binding domain-containing protein [Chloroflexota bacterium]